MKMTKKVLGMVLCGVMTVGMITGCGGSDSSTTNDAGNTSADAAQEISVVSREDGSGTRGAFVELFGVEDEENGEKVDKTTEEATIANSTEIVMTTVAGDKNAIGYCSLGSLNDSVKGLKIDGAEPTVDNINNGSYAISYNGIDLLTFDFLNETVPILRFHSDGDFQSEPFIQQFQIWSNTTAENLQKSCSILAFKLLVSVCRVNEIAQGIHSRSIESRKDKVVESAGTQPVNAALVGKAVLLHQPSG